MSQVSKYKVSENVEKRISEIFLQAISRLNKPEEISQFFEEFLTPTEKTVLSKRLAIGVMLYKGYDYYSIKKVLKVTPCTIAKAAYWIKHKKNGFLKIAQLIVEKEKNEEFWNEIGNTVGDILSLHRDVYSMSKGYTNEKPKEKPHPF